MLHKKKPSRASDQKQTYWTNRRIDIEMIVSVGGREGGGVTTVVKEGELFKPQT
jgi:hypothetical protein